MFLSEAMPYIAQTMDRGAAIVMLQKILIRKGKKIKFSVNLSISSRSMIAILRQEIM